MQGVEHRAGDIPVEAVGFGVEHGAVGQHSAKACGDLQPLGFRDADVDRGGAGRGSWLGGHGACA